MYQKIKIKNQSSKKIVEIQIPEFPTMESQILKAWDRTQESAIFNTQSGLDFSEPWTTVWATLSGLQADAPD